MNSGKSTTTFACAKLLLRPHR